MSDYTYGAEPLCPRVAFVKPMPDFKLMINFDNGEIRIFDAASLFEIKAFELLKNETFFIQVRTECGTIAWPGEIDYCPDTLYAQSVPVQ